MTGRQKEPVKESRSFTSVKELRPHIRKLKTRVEELTQMLELPTLDSGDIEPLRVHIVNNLRDLYWQNSPEFEKYEHLRIIPLTMRTGFENPYEEKQRDQQRYRLGIAKTIKTLNGVIVELEERVEMTCPSSAA